MNAKCHDHYNWKIGKGDCRSLMFFFFVVTVFPRIVSAELIFFRS